MWYKVSFDATGVQAGGEETRNILKSIGDQALAEEVRIGNAFKNLSASVSAGFSVNDVQGFLQLIIQVRSELDSTEESFKLLTGNAEATAKFMKEMQEYSLSSSFEISELADTSAELLAYQTELEDVITVIDKLSGIATGAGVPLGQLVAIFNKVKSQGKMMAEDMQLFENAGVPIAESLKKSFQTTTETLEEMVKKGEVGFSDMYAAMSKMSTKKVEFPGLKDNDIEVFLKSLKEVESTITSIVKEFELGPVLEKGGELVDELAGKYEAFGQIIAKLTALKGAYKTAVTVLTIAERVQTQIQLQSVLAGQQLTFTQGLQAVAASHLSRVQAVLNKTMLANPYVLLATAVVGLVALMWNLADSTSAAEKAQKRFNDEQNNFNEKQQQTRSEIGNLIGTIQNETETMYASQKAYDELSKKSKVLTDNYSLEELKTLDLAEANKLLNQSRDSEEYDNITKKIASLRLELERYDKYLNKRYESPEEVLMKMELEAELKEYENALAKINRIRKEAEKDLEPIEVKLFNVNAELDILDTLFNDVQQKIEEQRGKFTDDGFIDPTLLFKSNFLKEQITKKQDQKQGYEATIAENLPATAEAVYDKYNQQLADYAAKRDKILAKTLSPSERDAQLKAIDEQTKIIKEKIVSAGGEYIKAKREQQKKEQQEREKAHEMAVQNRISEANTLKNLNKKLEQDKAQAEVNVLADGFGKEKAQLDLNHKNRMAEIEQQEEDILNTLRENRKKEAEARGEENFDPSTVTLPPEVSTYFKSLRDHETTQNNTKNNDLIKKTLREFEDYQAQKLRIAEEYGNKIKELEAEKEKKIAEDPKADTSSYDSAITEATRKMNEDLAAIDDKSAKISDTVIKMFSDMGKLSSSEMRKIADEAEKMLAFIKGGEWDAKLGKEFGLTEEQFKNLNNKLKEGSPELEKYTKQVENIRKQADDTDIGFAKLASSTGNLFKAIKSGNVKDFQSALSGMSSSISSITGLTDMFADTLGGLGELTGSDFLKNASSGIKTVTSTIGDTMKGAQAGAALGPIGAAAGAALGLASSIVKTISETKKHNAEIQKQVDAFNQSVYMSEFKINQLYRERYDWSQKIGESQQDYLKRQEAELAKQQKGNKEDRDKLMGDLKKHDYLAEVRVDTKKKKHKEVKVYDSLGDKSWDEIKVLAEQGRLSEDAMKIYNQLLSNEKEGEDIEKKIEDYQKSEDERVTGTTVSSLTSSIVDGFKQGKRAAKDFADDFQGLMENAVSSSLALMVDDKMTEWYEDFAEKAGDGLTEDEINALRESYNGIIEAAAVQAENLKEVTGVTLGGEGQAGGATAKGFATMSQESADELNGRFTAMQGHTFAMTENTNILVANSSRLLELVYGIKEDTQSLSRLESIENNMQSMKSNIDDIVLRGIKINN